MRRYAGLGFAVLLASLAAWWLVGRGASDRRPETSEQAHGSQEEPGPARLEGEGEGTPPEEGAPGGGRSERDRDYGRPLEPWGELFDVTVVEADGGKAIADALVQVRIKFADEIGLENTPHAHEARTDERGTARIPRCQRIATWVVRKPGYRTVWPAIARDARAPRVALQCAPTFTGRALDADSGAALAGVRIRAYAVDEFWDPIDVEQVTDENGSFTLCGLPTSTVVEIRAIRTGYGTVGVGLGSRYAAEDGIEVTLGAGARIGGRVLDAAGDPVAEAEVFVTERGTPPPLRDVPVFGSFPALYDTRAVADASGRYLVRGIPTPAQVVVYASAPDGAEGRSDVISLPHADARPEVDVTVTTLGSIAVSFVNAATGEAVSPDGARCSLDVPWTEAQDHQKARDDSAAAVTRLRDVPAGKHTIHVDSRSHLSPRPVEVDVQPGEEMNVEIALESGLTVTGRVVDGEGQPVEVYVAFWAEYQGVAQYPNARTDERGRFTLDAVPPVAGEFSVFDDAVGERRWEDREIAGDLGDIVLARRPVLKGRLPQALREDPPVIACGVLTTRHGGVLGGLDVAEDGTFQVNGLFAGDESTVFLRPRGGTALVLRDLVFEPGEVRDLGVVEFPEPHAVVGRLLDAQGQPVESAFIRTLEWWGEDRTRTDREGRFRLDRLPPGRSTLWVETAPHELSFRDVDVTGDMDEIEIRLPAPGTLACRVLREDDTPVAGMAVSVGRLLDTGHPDWERRTIPRTDSTGLFEIQLPPTAYAIGAHPPAGMEVVGSVPRVSITSGERVEIEIRVRAGE